MSPDRAYRCSECFEHTVSRSFDTSHLSTNCPVCDSFERFINDEVVTQFRAFQESPPESIDWERLDRTERLLLSERVVRTTRSVEDFEVTG
jgi:phage FluMu protein Com